MENLIDTVSLIEWIIFGIAILALLVSVLAWRRAGKVLKTNHKPVEREAENLELPATTEEPKLNVNLEITADKNEFDQVTLKISNAGILSAKNISVTIDKPSSIFDAESLNEGVEVANVTDSSAILPRLAILDAENKFPINEISSGQNVGLPAALTMAHGKICEFPVVVDWQDEEGNSQHKVIELTI